MDIKNKKVELLAPAGNYEGFIGAINAGADAVYLGGNKFSARAYANNFSTEEICSAIVYAHLFEKKVYLTVNTLLKNTELEMLYEYIKPFVEVGLDGVIIQDIGVFFYIKEQFPTLELHVSTQMAITGIYGAKLLYKLGAVRIVPARELSLTEIREIKKQVPIEMETFIHGAMCYSYSGNCLFSSILGGRSGNRGRCAQPCRLPYSTTKTKQEQYPLSLKDMCTLPYIKNLIESGIDSFKIEGRMKRAEYTAGVTAIYRKYIDLYYENPKESFEIEREDMDMLQKLYIRSEIQNGYYQKHNGKEMVTLSSPTYEKTEEALLQKIRTNYLEKTKKVSVQGKIELTVGEPVIFTIFKDMTKLRTTGDIVLEAIKQPLTKETIEKQLQRTGDSNFSFEKVEITLNGACFLPVKSLNEIRRSALEVFEQEFLKTLKKSTQIVEKKYALKKLEIPSTSTCKQLQIQVLTAEQLEAVLLISNIDRIYLSIDLLLEKKMARRNELLVSNFENPQKLFFVLPYITRERSYSHLNKTEELFAKIPHKGVLIRNFEQLQWLKDISYQGEIIADANLYCFNKKSIQFWESQGISITLPYELNEKELLQLGVEGHTLCAYGRIPMMITANCIAKTMEKCKQSEASFKQLTDRFQKKFPVYVTCVHCYNIIYNSVPLFLLKQSIKWRNEKNINIRLDFTIESKEEMLLVINQFIESLQGKAITTESLPKDFTKGHFNRGVE